MYCKNKEELLPVSERPDNSLRTTHHRQFVADISSQNIHKFYWISLVLHESTKRIYAIQQQQK